MNIVAETGPEDGWEGFDTHVPGIMWPRSAPAQWTQIVECESCEEAVVLEHPTLCPCCLSSSTLMNSWGVCVATEEALAQSVGES